MIWVVLALCVLNIIFTYFVSLRIIARVEKIEYLMKKFKMSKEIDDNVCS